MNRVHRSEEAPRSFTGTMAPCAVVERLEGKHQCNRAAVGEHAGIPSPRMTKLTAHGETKGQWKMTKPCNSPSHNQLSPPLPALAFLALQPMIEPSTPPERDTHPLLDPNSQRSINSSMSRFSSSQMWTKRVSLLRGFFFLLFFPQKQVLLCLSCGRWRISQTLGPQCPRNLTIT